MIKERKNFSMKMNFYKLVWLFSLLVVTPSSIANEFDVSIEEKVSSLRKSILISNATNSREKSIQTITSNGFGTSIEAAAQNAAENALTQVVGSFIDSETLIKKQKEIRDGVVSKTKSVKKDIKDYSQGSIKYFEILNVNQNGSIYNVTARVDVRIDDFKAYIKQLAYGSTSVSKELSTNLFTQSITSEKNLDNKYKLFQKNVIDPIRKAEVYEIEIGDIKSLDNWQTNSEYCRRKQNGYCSKKGFYANWDRNRTFVFPVSISLAMNFQENMLNTLENISDKRIDTFQFNSFEWGYRATAAYRNSYDINRDYPITFISANKKNKKTYILKDILYKFKRDNNIPDKNLDNYFFSNPSVRSWRGNCNSQKKYFNPLLLKFLDENNNDLQTYEYSAWGCNNTSYPISIWESYTIREKEGNEGAYTYFPEYSLFSSGMDSNSEKAIFAKRTYFIVAELDLGILKNLRKIEIEFFQKNK